MSKRVVSPQIEIGEDFHFAPKTISLFGIVGMLFFPLYYFIWHDFLPQPYENFTLRMIAMFLCLPLVLYAQWPRALKRHLPTYWNLCLLYVSFFFTFMLFKNEFNQVWSMSILVSVFIMMLLASNWKNFVAIILLGSIAAWIVFAIEQGGFVLPDGFLEYLAILLFTMFVGSLFNYSSYNARIRVEKLETLVSTSGNIAHELRTPLLSIKSDGAGLHAYLPLLLDAYQIAREHGLSVPLIRKEHKTKLIDLPKRISREVDYANTVIDMLLVSSDRGVIQAADFSKQSMKHCIQTTLERYPFNSDEDRQRVHWGGDDDFAFIGSDILTIHVLFNLMKNALYAIAKAGKGEVTISLSSEEDYYHLHFRDTGSGIKKDDLSRIFERFYSTSKYGHGVGLSYCSMVMQSFHGNIECFSVEHEYTEFQLNFPKEPS